MNVGIEKKLAAADVGIEKKLAAASASRENNLVAKSSTKKRMLSPRSSPSDKKEIEARINEANLRREIYLTSKVEKAKNGKSSSPKINKALFTAVSPMRGGENNSSSRERISPRIKAARLEEFAVRCNYMFFFRCTKPPYGTYSSFLLVRSSLIASPTISFFFFRCKH